MKIQSTNKINFQSKYTNAIRLQRKRQFFNFTDVDNFIKEYKNGKLPSIIKDGNVQADFSQSYNGIRFFHMIFTEVKGIENLYEDSNLIKYIDNLLVKAKQNCKSRFEDSAYPVEYFYNDGKLSCEDVYIKSIENNNYFTKKKKLSLWYSIIYDIQTQKPLYRITHAAKDGILERKDPCGGTILPIQKYGGILKYNKNTGKPQFRIDNHRGIPSNGNGLHAEIYTLYDKNGKEALIKHNYGTISEPLIKSIQCPAKEDNKNWLEKFLLSYIK